MMITWIVASCGTTSQIGGSGCFGYWNTDGPQRGTRDANRTHKHPYRQCVEKAVSHSWWNIEWRSASKRNSIYSLTPILFQHQKYIGFSRTNVSWDLKSLVKSGLIRCLFLTDMRMLMTLSADFGFYHLLTTLLYHNGLSQGFQRYSYNSRCIRLALQERPPAL